METFLHGGITLFCNSILVPKTLLHEIILKITNDLVHDCGMPPDLASAISTLLLSNTLFKYLSDGTVEGTGFIQDGVSYKGETKWIDQKGKNWNKTGIHDLTDVSGSFFEYFIFCSEPAIFEGKPFEELWATQDSHHPYFKQKMNLDVYSFEYGFNHLLHD
ncbi:hypothetical protein [Manitoba virus]|uniref:Uncharacterized protein n=1 Tax=Manitoba virus TaxID=1272949 RepID=A0A0D3R1H7_9RHAB|nr:hypothetical protein [Manitoba virus]AJR28471.1 hypothetical protein [Manitoba virus]